VKVSILNVLFVCWGNAFRSPVAEALLKKLRPDIQADSAGVDPGIPVSESARRYLSKEGAEGYLKRTPEGLDSKDLGEYDFIVAMEGRHREAVLDRSPDCADKTVVWNIQDPYLMSSSSGEKVFSQIKRKVEELADSLQ
jgi:protein-tyrosine phosphatase